MLWREKEDFEKLRRKTKMLWREKEDFEKLGKKFSYYIQLRAEGKFRAEGAQYVVKDGDILVFKFSTQNLK